MIDCLNTADLEILMDLASKLKDKDAFEHIRNSQQQLTANRQPRQDLDEDTLKELSSNQVVHSLMILYFLTKNVVLEHLRRNRIIINSSHVSVSVYWSDIYPILLKKLQISRFVRDKFNDKNIERFANITKDIRIDDVVSFELTKEGENKPCFQMLLTGKISIPKGQSFNNPHTQIYIKSHRKTCFHKVIYDPFKFEVAETSLVYLHPNKVVGKKNINSIGTVKFSRPQLIIIYNDNKYVVIPTDKIKTTLDDLLENKEIDENLFNKVKSDYPNLFLPILDKQTVNHLLQEFKKLIQSGIKKSKDKQMPLLIVLSEVHGSKDSFLLNLIALIVAKKNDIHYAFFETINVHHEKYGWDANSEAISKLMEYCKKYLEYNVFDLEQSLHYKNIRSPYPYHEIPLSEFGIPLRESSWIRDLQNQNKSAVLIVGTGHLNSMVNSELNNNFVILPIDCSGNREYSDALSVSKYNHIDMNCDINEFLFNEIIALVNKSAKFTNLT